MINSGESPVIALTELLSSELTDVFESIELDDVVVWERNTV